MDDKKFASGCLEIIICMVIGAFLLSWISSKTYTDQLACIQKVWSESGGFGKTKHYISIKGGAVYNLDENLEDWARYQEGLCYEIRLYSFPWTFPVIIREVPNVN